MSQECPKYYQNQNDFLNVKYQGTSKQSTVVGICTSINVSVCESAKVDPLIHLLGSDPISPPSSRPSPRPRADTAEHPAGRELAVAGDCSTAASDCRHRPAHCSTQLSSLRPGCCPLQHCRHCRPGKLAGAARQTQPSLNYLSSHQNQKTNSLLPGLSSMITSGLNLWLVSFSGLAP